MNASASTLNAIAEDVKRQFVARDEVVDYLKLSVVARQNMLLLGPPGAAKSEVITAFLSRLGGRKGFFALFQGDPQEKLLGPLSIREYKEHDVFKHNIEGMAPDVEWLWIDEVFKANAPTRNGILTILNERKFKNGNELVHCPLRMAVSASNEYPDAREDAAFFDRYLTRIELGYLPDHAQRMRMVQLTRLRRPGDINQEPEISLEELDALYELTREVTVSEAAMDIAAVLYDQLALLGPEACPGDRRFAQSFQLAAAKAVCEGRDTVIPDDLEVFMHTAWTNPEVRTNVHKTVLKSINPELADITTLFDEIEEAFDTFRTTRAGSNRSEEYMPAHRQFLEMTENNIKKIQSVILELEEQGRDATKAREFRARAKSRVDESIELAWGTRGGADDGA